MFKIGLLILISSGVYAGELVLSSISGLVESTFDISSPTAESLRVETESAVLDWSARQSSHEINGSSLFRSSSRRLSEELAGLCQHIDEELLDDEGLYRPAITQCSELGNIRCQRDDFLIGVMIGEGSFGKVYKAIHMPTGKKVALKYIKYTGRGINRLSSIRQEECLQHRFDYPSICKHYCTYVSEFAGSRYVVLVLEYIDGIDLWELIYNAESLEDKALAQYSTDHVLTWSVQLVLILEALQRESVVSLDIKPENLMVDEKGNLHLIDFGLAGDPTRVSRYSRGRRMGSELYYAPENLSGHAEDWHTFEADVYDAGLVLYEILYKEFPFAPPENNDDDDAREALFESILRGVPCNPSSLEIDEPDIACDLIKQMTDLVPERRLSAGAIRFHQWFEGIDLDNMVELYRLDDIQEAYRPVLVGASDSL
jgi:calcium-dependent protein kinase